MVVGREGLAVFSLVLAGDGERVVASFPHGAQLSEGVHIQALVIFVHIEGGEEEGELAGEFLGVVTVQHLCFEEAEILWRAFFQKNEFVVSESF